MCNQEQQAANTPVESLPPAPIPSRSARWYAQIRLPRCPVCPVCAEVLDPLNISTWRSVVMCTPCATRTRVANWPDPFVITEVLQPNSILVHLGLIWYSPPDFRPEPAIGRYIRLAYEANRCP